MAADKRTAADDRAAKLAESDVISRGNHNPTLAGRVAFVGLRTLDVFLQYGILAHGLGAPLLHRVGLSTLPAGAGSQTGIALIDALQLSPYRLALLGLAGLSALKQIYWAVFVAAEDISVPNAAIIAALNTANNSINSLLFTTVRFSASVASGAQFPQIPLLVGGATALTGFVVETVAEEQRKWFKKDPKNKGQVYTGGLFGIVRHVNYTGYTLWRFGYALASGGATWASGVAAFFVYNFVTRSIPILDNYCGGRYGIQWEQYKRDVPYKLLPGVY